MATRGAQLLSAFRNAEIARATHVSERTASYWKSGSKLPSETSAAALEAAFGIAREAWHRPPAEPAGLPVATPPAEGKQGELVDAPASQPGPTATAAEGLDGELPADGTAAPRMLPIPTAGYARDTLDTAEACRALLRDLNGEKGAALSLAARSKLLREVAGTLRQLGARGTDNLSQVSREAIETSPSWTALLVMLGKVLEQYPDALHAVSEALARDGTAARATGR